MQEIKFAVQGSASEPYEVRFTKLSDTDLAAYCTCRAGIFGKYCKHRINIFGGISKGIVSGNEHDVETVKSWLAGTDIEAAIALVLELEAEQEKIKKKLTAAKKVVAKVMQK